MPKDFAESYLKQDHSHPTAAKPSSKSSGKVAAIKVAYRNGQPLSEVRTRIFTELQNKIGRFAAIEFSASVLFLVESHTIEDLKKLGRQHKYKLVLEPERPVFNLGDIFAYNESPDEFIVLAKVYSDGYAWYTLTTEGSGKDRELIVDEESTGTDSVVGFHDMIRKKYYTRVGNLYDAAKEVAEAGDGVDLDALILGTGA